jgi:hypothetical protein
MGDVDKYRKFLKGLIKEEVKTDTNLERLKPRTDELGNFMVPKLSKKVKTQLLSSQQSNKNDTLRQDLERQTKLSQTITEKRKELESGLTVVPVEQTKNTVQRIGDMIDMQDQARKNAKRLVDDPDEEQNIMTELLRRGLPDVTLFNKVYPELFKFFEGRTLITADEIMLQFDKIKKRINLQATSDDFVFTRDTMATLVGDIMTQLANVPPTPALIAAISTIETAVNAIETGNVDSRAKLDNITGALGNLSTDMQNMNPTALANAVVQLSQSMPVMMSSAAPVAPVASAAPVAGTAPVASAAPVAGTAPVVQSGISVDDMNQLVTSIIARLSGIVTPSQAFLDALAKVEGAVIALETGNVESRKQSDTMTKVLEQVAQNVQQMDPTLLADSIVKLSQSLPAQLSNAVTSSLPPSLHPDEMRSLVGDIIAKLDNVPASPELLNAIGSVESAVKAVESGNPAMLSALQQLSMDIQTMDPTELKNAIVALSARIPDVKDEYAEITEDDISDPTVAAYFRRMINHTDRGTPSETFEYVKYMVEDLLERFKDATHDGSTMKIAFGHENGDKGDTPFNNWGIVRNIFLDKSSSTKLNYKKAKEEFADQIIPAYESLRDVFEPDQKMSGGGIGRKSTHKRGAGGGASTQLNNDNTRITYAGNGRRYRNGQPIFTQKELDAIEHERAKRAVTQSPAPPQLSKFQQKFVDKAMQRRR